MMLMVVMGWDLAVCSVEEKCELLLFLGFVVGKIDAKKGRCESGEPHLHGFLIFGCDLIILVIT